MSIRAAVYLRISLDHTGEERAVTRQREDAFARIKREKWTLGEVYIDNGISASRREKRRPEYDRMRADFEAGRFSVLVCYDLDRLTRQPSQLEEWIALAETRGLRIVTTNGDVDLGTDGGKMYARIKAAVAKGEVERMGARRKRSNEQTVAEGRPAPGRRPYGWELGGIELREEEARVVRDIYAAVLAGESVRALVRDLNARNVPSPALAAVLDKLDRRQRKGESVPPEVWEAARASAYPWTAFKTRQLIDRERNYGALVRYGVEQPTSVIQAIVDRDTHEKAQAIISERSQPGRKPEKHLLSGLATCAVCEMSLGAKQLRDGSGERSPYYVCTSRINRNVASDGKIHPTIRSRILEERAREEVVAAFLYGPAELFPGQDDGDLGDLHKRLKRTREELGRIVYAIGKGTISQGRAASQVAVLEREEDALVAAIQEAQARASTGRFVDIRRGVIAPGERVDVGRVVEVRQALAAEYNSLPFDARRSLTAALLDIRVAPGYGAKRANIVHKVVTSLNDGEPLLKGDEDAA